MGLISARVAVNDAVVMVNIGFQHVVSLLVDRAVFPVGTEMVGASVWPPTVSHIGFSRRRHYLGAV